MILFLDSITNGLHFLYNYVSSCGEKSTSYVGLSLLKIIQQFDFIIVVTRNDEEEKKLENIGEWSAHAPVNGGPVFPGTILGHFWFFCVLCFLFYQNFQIRTPWCNAHI